MPAPISSPALKPDRDRAPEPSPALIALQEKGLELAFNRVPSISPQSDPAFNGSLRVSPLSLLSTPSNLEKPLPLEPGERWRKRPSSADSGESVVSRILNLYANMSDQSLKSEYEEMIYYADDNSDEDDSRPPLPTVHQPKAYRDTIAPLLEHQFSTERLVVPPMPSPMSIASMPQLIHPNANISVTSLRLTPQTSPSLQPMVGKVAAYSQTSIQITPEMTPPPMLPSFDLDLPDTYAPSFAHYSQSLQQRKIALEVPDVREADSWYDQPLSPVSPEEHQSQLRDSQMSAVSPDEAVNYQRQFTYNALVPPITYTFPNMRPVSTFLANDFLPGPISATVTQIVDNKMVPAPLDLSVGKVRPVSEISEECAPVHETGIEVGRPNHLKWQHASLIAEDPIEGPMRSYLTPPPADASSIPPKSRPDSQQLREIYRRGSAFSDSSEDRKAHDSVSGHLKAAFRFGKNRSGERSSKGSNGTKDKYMGKDKKKQKVQSVPIPTTKNASTAFQEDLESYKYNHWKTHVSVPSNSVHARLNSQELRSFDVTPPAIGVHRIGAQPQSLSPPLSFDLDLDLDLDTPYRTYLHPQSDDRGSSMHSGPGPSVSSSPQPRQSSDMKSPPRASISNELGTPTSNASKPTTRPLLKRRSPQPAIPLTPYQIHGPSIWEDEKQQKKRARHEAKAAEKAAKQAEKEARKLDKTRAKNDKRRSAVPVASAQLNSFFDPSSSIDSSNDEITRASQHGYKQGTQVHSRPTSNRAYASMAQHGYNANEFTNVLSTTPISRQSTESGSIASSSAGRSGPVYNNDLFEASGGAKKARFASRLLMSSEEKRKRKVKKSITVVGGGKMGSAVGGAVGVGMRTSEGGTKGLVKI